MRPTELESDSGSMAAEKQGGCGRRSLNRAAAELQLRRGRAPELESGGRRASTEEGQGAGAGRKSWVEKMGSCGGRISNRS